MTRINYKSDFTLSLSGIGFPDYDFEVTLRTSGATKFVASKVTDADGAVTLTNCKEGDDAIVVIAEGHGLGCGVLRTEVCCYVPDEDYADGVRKSVFNVQTGYELCVGVDTSDEAIVIDAEVPAIVSAALGMVDALEGAAEASATLVENSTSIAENSETIAGAVETMQEGAESITGTAESLSESSATLSEIVSGTSETQASLETLVANLSEQYGDLNTAKAALVEAMQRQNIDADMTETLSALAEKVLRLAVVYRLTTAGVAVYETTSEDETVTLMYKAEYFQSIVVDGEELQDGTVTGALTYTFAEAGNHDVTLQLIDNPTTLAQCWYNCTALVGVAADVFEGCGNVTNLQQAFYGCTKLLSADLSTFNSLVYLGNNGSGYYGCFRGCSKLTEVTLPEDCSSLKYADGAFYGCSSLTTPPDLSACTALTNGQSMFYGCSSTSFTVEDLDVTNLQNMTQMFNGCTGIRKLSLVGFGTFGGLTVTNTFYNVTNWGGEDWILTEEEHLQSLEDTLLNNSYDREANGYSTLTVTLPSAVLARLTDDQIEAITAKGYSLGS